MQTKFKRHEKVRLLAAPDIDYIEYDPAFDEEKPPITKGMVGKINVLLPNGEYHVEIVEEKTGKTIAYVPMNEESLEKVE
ncbi:MAG: hypothetical protein KJ600_00675 [Nanoarchaeota archaeon]|nr:hypothetical protein [Nanoarchaeota archaeon]MBU1103057.1 hypothetical protein [Nanoarchaeota archaeon]MBU1989004.1 hypothetical protein [Nanoarchaeota archaeon]